MRPLVYFGIKLLAYRVRAHEEYIYLLPRRVTYFFPKFLFFRSLSLSLPSIRERHNGGPEEKPPDKLKPHRRNDNVGERGAGGEGEQGDDAGGKQYVNRSAHPNQSPGIRAGRASASA